MSLVIVKEYAIYPDWDILYGPDVEYDSDLHDPIFRRALIVDAKTTDSEFGHIADKDAEHFAIELGIDLEDHDIIYDQYNNYSDPFNIKDLPVDVCEITDCAGYEGLAYYPIEEANEIESSSTRLMTNFKDKVAMTNNPIEPEEVAAHVPVRGVDPAPVECLEASFKYSVTTEDGVEIEREVKYFIEPETASNLIEIDLIRHVKQMGIFNTDRDVINYVEELIHTVGHDNRGLAMERYLDWLETHDFTGQDNAA